ncbi:MAG: single-stranded-DNA-specific exonuclease RecJ [Parvibaculaceae bacterium]|nr:single-stranded-DNA-specific exonuclease RecJ [Parvibaculaceae bacterium]
MRIDTKNPAGQASPQLSILGVERSVTGRAWMPRLADDRLSLALAQRLDLPEIVARVLAGRGVGVEEAEAYLNPSIRSLMPDPSTLMDMDAAASRIARAIMEGEAVAVFGDYDVDGATSSALFARFFRALGQPLRIYIPDRIIEGYGPNAAAFEQLAGEGIRLVITVDCGTLAFAPLEAAAAAGLDVVVADHHIAEPGLPRACAVVNPNRIDDESGLGQLAAAGVTYLLIVAINRTLRQAGYYNEERQAPDLLALLDLVALGTVCDVVPLTGLNRAFVFQGLKIMARRKNVGLAALGAVSRLDGLPGTYHLGFLLGPRVNAGGRVGKSDLGVRLLVTEDDQEAEELAAVLDMLNKERQAIEAQVLQEAIGAVEAGMMHGARNKPSPVIVAKGRGWHPGVIGIVASRLKELYDRPALVIAIDENGMGKGSGRSVAGVDLGRAVTRALEAGLLVNGGGHVMAAGLTVEADRLDELEAFLAIELEAQVAAAGENRSLRLDGAVAVSGATRALHDLLMQAGPYGAGNAEPRFAVPSARIVRADVVGQNHVRCIVTDGTGGRLKAIAFKALGTPLGDLLMDRNAGTIHLAGRLKPDDWQGRNDVQLQIEDAAPAIRQAGR